jgi:dihydrofolate reductase
MKSIVVAYDKNFGIGAGNDLLWMRDLPADLTHFKELTTGHTIIMGRKTFDSIGRALPHRQSIVISREQLSIPDVTVVSSIEEAYKAANDESIFIIGGGQIYELAMDSVDQILATEVDGVFKPEVFFPRISDTWIESNREHHEKDDRNKYNYDFVTYVRR